jgi:hypothetical protein
MFASNALLTVSLFDDAASSYKSYLAIPVVTLILLAGLR